MRSIKEISKIHFSSGALFAPKISLDWVNEEFQYCYNQFGSSEKRYEELKYQKNIAVCEKDIVAFLDVCDSLYLREWNQYVYRNDDILDGLGWSIDIDITVEEEGKTTLYQVAVEGYAAFPNAYREFIKGIEKLIHESMTSRAYNAQVMKEFMGHNIKGSENRSNLFKKVSPVILEAIEGEIDLYLLEYSMEDILDEYMNILRIFGISESDKSIMKYYIWGCEGNKNEIGIEILDFINPSLKKLYEYECRMLLAEADIWYLDKEAQEDIDRVFTQTRMILLYADKRNTCCESHNRDDNKRTLKALSLELAKTVTNLKKYTDDNMITHESYNPKAKDWLRGNIAKYLDHIEKEAKKIKEIGCCMRQYDYTLLKDEAVHDLVVVLAKKLFDEVLKFIDRLHITFQRAEGITKKLIIRDGDIIDLVEVMGKNHDFSDILPLIEVFDEPYPNPSTISKTSK